MFELVMETLLDIAKGKKNADDLMKVGNLLSKEIREKTGVSPKIAKEMAKEYIQAAKETLKEIAKAS